MITSYLNVVARPPRPPQTKLPSQRFFAFSSAGFVKRGKTISKEEASLIGRDCRAGRGFQGAIFVRTDAGDLLLELLGAAVLGRLLPPVVRAARHVVRDHVLGLANHACLFLGQCRREVELRSGLTCGCREGMREVGGQRSGARGEPESAGECAQSRGGKLSARRAALGGRARPRFGPGVAGGGLAARGMRSRWVRTFALSHFYCEKECGRSESGSRVG